MVKKAGSEMRRVSSTPTDTRNRTWILKLSHENTHTERKMRSKQRPSACSYDVADFTFQEMLHKTLLLHI